MRRIAWSTAVVGGAVLAMLAVAGTLRAGPGLPEDEKPRARQDVAPGATKVLLPQRPDLLLPAVPAVLETEVKRLRAAEVTPRDAVFFATIPDISRLKTGSEGLALARILREPPTRARVDAAIAAFRARAKTSPMPGFSGFLQMALALDIDYEPVRVALRKELAVIGLRPREGKELRLAAVAAVGADRRALTEFIDTLMGEMQTQYQQFSVSQKEHRGESIRTLESPSLQVSCAYLENLLLVGTGRGTVAELMDTLTAGRDKQLAGDPAFKAAEEDFAKGADLFYKVDLAQLGPLVASVAGGAAQVQPQVPGQGTVWGAVYLDGAAVRERIETRAPKGTKVSPITAGEPLASPPKAVQYFPVDTAFFMAVSLDPSKAIAEALEDTRTGPGVAAALAAAGSALGAKLDPELLAAFGGELAVGVILPPGRPPELLAALEVKKPDAIGKAVDVMEQVMGQNRVKAATYREYTLRYVEPPAQGVGRPSVWRALFPDPAYTRTPAGDMFLFASSRRALEKAIRQYEHRRSSLVEKPDFVRCMGPLRARRTSVVYADVPRLVGLLTSRIPLEGGESVEGPFAGRADIEAALPHLFGLGAVSDDSPSTTVQESWGPVGPVTGLGLLLLAGAGGAGVEDDAEVLKLDRAKLQRIGGALQLYATDFDRFPMALSELYAPQYLQDRSAFEAPGGRQAIRDRDDIDTRSDYVYVKGLTPADLSDKIILYSSRVLNSGGIRGRNVLFVSGRAEFVPESSFQMMLQRQTAGQPGRP